MMNAAPPLPVVLNKVIILVNFIVSNLEGLKLDLAASCIRCKRGCAEAHIQAVYC